MIYQKMPTYMPNKIYTIILQNKLKDVAEEEKNFVEEGVLAVQIGRWVKEFTIENVLKKTRL